MPFFSVRKAFPFASLDGSYYVLPSETYVQDPRYERPVVSIFEGTEVHFYSLARMLDTVIDWFEQGVRSPIGGPVVPDREMAIWRQHNPGAFSGS